MPYVPKYLAPGTVFNAWTVLSEGRVGSGARIRRIAHVRCECGEEGRVLVSDLKHGNSKSCGCRHHQSRMRGLTRKQLEADRALRYKYGVSIETKARMAEAQGNACAICGEVTTLVIDHNHSTGSVRGLLCGQCNLGLGFFSDDAGRLLNAIRYLATTDHAKGVVS